MSSPTPEVRCSRCGELNSPERASCWLCFSALQPAAEAKPLSSLHSDSPSIPEKGLLSFTLISALAVVCLGVFLIAPGFGIVMAIVLAVPVARTVLVVRRRAQSGMQTTLVSRAGMFIRSILFVWIVLTVTCIAAFGAFCLTCLAMVATNQSRSGVADVDESAVAVAGLATLIVVAVFGYAFYKGIRSRWHADLNR